MGFFPSTVTIEPDPIRGRMARAPRRRVHPPKRVLAAMAPVAADDDY